jgi:hypothetical protein
LCQKSKKIFQNISKNEEFSKKQTKNRTCPLFSAAICFTILYVAPSISSRSPAAISPPSVAAAIGRVRKTKRERRSRNNKRNKFINIKKSY